MKIEKYICDIKECGEEIHSSANLKVVMEVEFLPLKKEDRKLENPQVYGSIMLDICPKCIATIETSDRKVFAERIEERNEFRLE